MRVAMFLLLISRNIYFSGFSAQSEVQGGIIICALRSKDSSHCLEMANLASKYLQKTKNDPIGVVGFDLAGKKSFLNLNSILEIVMIIISKLTKFTLIFHE